LFIVAASVCSRLRLTTIAPAVQKSHMPLRAKKSRQEARETHIFPNSLATVPQTDQ
jgi:hypothetical protein